MAKILLVEDEELLRKIYRKKLELAQFEVETAADGKEGLAKAREFKPDLILLDIFMPKLNGIEVLKEIKAATELKGIPVVMLTNIAGSAAIQECLQAGALGYIIKSSGTPSKLLREIKKFIGVRCRIEDSQKSNILIIEDTTVLQRMYTSRLKEDGYEVNLARDGGEGLYKALNTDPDLVLLDLMLPKVDGFHILAELRKNPKTQKTPVIILSNQGQAEDATKALQLGANDYIVKINTPPSSVLKKIQVLLSQREAEDTINHLVRYHIKIQTTQADAPQLAQDFAFIFTCVECETQLTLELIHGYTSTGPGHRFVAQFVCPKCSKIY